MDTDKVISHNEYIMLSNDKKSNYIECELCYNHFIMNEGGLLIDDIVLCDECTMDRHKN